jgi:FlaG/FlaF family flagellin (archaellin)
MNAGCERYQGVCAGMRKIVLKNNTCRASDAGISEMVSSTLIIILVVVLAGIVAAIILGYFPGMQKPTLAAFSTNPVTDSSKAITAIELHVVTGDQLSAKAGSGSLPGGGGYLLSNLNIILTDPNGVTNVTRLCAGTAPMTITPGKSLFIFKRNQPVYYLANSTSASNCGGTGGSGGGLGGGNKEFLPHGTWRIVIADTANSNTVVYDGTIKL